MKTQIENKKFNQWLAGLIDGDGYFYLSKKGYASLEITMETRDAQCLYKIKNQFGGSIKAVGKLKALRYRIHNKEGIINIINAVNGEIRNPTRIAQLFKISEKYKINLNYASNLTYDNAWLSGFIDSDGSVYYNLKSIQIFITISQKNKLLLDIITPIYGGEIKTVKTTDSFKWTISKKSDVLTFLNYIKINNLYSAKMVRIRLIPSVYDCFRKGLEKSDPITIEGKIWKEISEKWEGFYENKD